jgi:hypothetical protein
MTDKRDHSWVRSAAFQSFVSVAGWLTFGLVLEGFLGYKTPAYLHDVVRRELFRLAHAHGTLLSVLLLVSALACDRFDLEVARSGQVSLRIGVTVLPLGFLIAGVWHYESDPGLAIWLVPVSAVMVLFGLVTIVMSFRQRKDS